MPKSSPRQKSANRNNARKSTGPKTEAGKQSSAGNATKHGAFAQVTYEQQPQYAELLAAFRAEFRPVSATENVLVDQLAQAQCDIERYRNVEFRLLNDNDLFGADKPATINLFNYLQRAQNSAHRRFFRNLELLKELVGQRPFQPPALEQKPKPPRPAESLKNGKTKPNQAPCPSDVTLSVAGKTIEDTIALAGEAALDAVIDTTAVKRLNEDCFTAGAGNTRGEQLRNWLTDVLKQMAARNLALKTAGRVIVEAGEITALAAGTIRDPKLHPLRVQTTRIKHADLYPSDGQWFAEVCLERS